jgi:hypothetical protein
MKEIDFTSLVQQKIEERREGRSATRQAAVEADARFHSRAAPLVAAASDMAEDLSKDPMFVNAMGKPHVIIKRTDNIGLCGSARFPGRAGAIVFQVHDRGTVSMRIEPEFRAAEALGCGLTYAPDSLQGDLSNIEDLIFRARDHIADFLADIYLSPVAHLLEPEK